MSWIDKVFAMYRVSFPPRMVRSIPFSTEPDFEIWAVVAFCQGLLTKRELKSKDLMIFLEKLKKYLRKTLGLSGTFIAVSANGIFPERSLK